MLTDDLGQGILRAAFDDLRQTRIAVRHHAVTRLDGQIILRPELLVKAALGEVRSAHQVIQADAIETALAEQLSGFSDDHAAVLFRLSPTDSHKTLHRYDTPIIFQP